jgi:hypothetical protein
MRRTQLLSIVCVSLCWAVAATHQAPSSAVLSTALRGHLQKERFDVVTSVRGLPLGVREALQALFKTPSLDIAEPGAEFQSTDVMVTPKLPSRRLVAAGCSGDHHCLVYYERGGFAHTWHAALFQWSPEATRFEFGGAAPGSLTSIADVRNALVAGEIKGPAKSW